VSTLDEGPGEAVSVSRLDLDAGGVLVLLTLSRPEDLNPLDHATIVDLRTAVAGNTGPDVRALAITGSGRAFSAGGDMKAYGALLSDAAGFDALIREFHGLVDDLIGLPVPVIALVNGIAVAGGLELLLACDFAVASASARIGDRHQRYGMMGGGGALSVLPHAVGPARARLLTLTGRLLDAEEALSWGLVAEVVADADLLDAGRRIAEEVATASPLSIRMAKEVMNHVWFHGLPPRAAMEHERETTLRYCLTSEDASEGVRAFVEKRRPRYRGR
jgi:enoyl-CoA hydratase/carnithine racemase